MKLFPSLTQRELSGHRNRDIFNTAYKNEIAIQKQAKKLHKDLKKFYDYFYQKIDKDIVEHVGGAQLKSLLCALQNIATSCLSEGAFENLSLPQIKVLQDILFIQRKLRGIYSFGEEGKQKFNEGQLVLNKIDLFQCTHKKMLMLSASFLNKAAGVYVYLSELRLRCKIERLAKKLNDNHAKERLKMIGKEIEEMENVLEHLTNLYSKDQPAYHGYSSLSVEQIRLYNALPEKIKTWHCALTDFAFDLKISFEAIFPEFGKTQTRLGYPDDGYPDFNKEEVELEINALVAADISTHHPIIQAQNYTQDDLQKYKFPRSPIEPELDSIQRPAAP